MSSAAVPAPDDPRVHAFVIRHQAGLWRWLRALGCEPADAEEHCQDALLAALHDDVDQRPPGEAAAWLRTAAKNLFLMQLRRERRRPRWLSIEVIEASWVALGGDEDGGEAAVAALNRCLLALPARDRELIAARYQRGSSRRAMAAQLGLGEAGVKQALRRVRDKLRACVGQRLTVENTPAATRSPRWNQ